MNAISWQNKRNPVKYCTNRNASSAICIATFEYLTLGGKQKSPSNQMRILKNDGNNNNAGNDEFVEKKLVKNGKKCRAGEVERWRGGGGPW